MQAKNEVYCEHLSCSSCRVINSKCKCACSCKYPGPLLKLNCGDIFCRRCSTKDTCKKCFDKECDFCMNIKEAKFINEKCRHLLCVNCYDPKMCYACNPQFYCNRCFKVSAEVEHCKVHKYCYSCILISKCGCLCPKCNKLKKSIEYDCGHTSCICGQDRTCIYCFNLPCNLCNTSKNMKSKPTVCGHILCSNCFRLDNCDVCNPQAKCESCLKYVETKELYENKTCSQCWKTQHLILKHCEYCNTESYSEKNENNTFSCP